MGGLARTVEHDGWRVDLGGHRFYTTVPAVEALWHEILPDDEFPLCRRMSRILYRGRLYDYPLRAGNVVVNLGPLEAARCLASYAWARARPPRDQGSYEGWLAARFGRRLYRTFFETYTEKVWGTPPRAMPADWAAQRVRDLNLTRAILGAVGVGRATGQVRSLVEEFHYPRGGAGRMWERCRSLAQAHGARFALETTVRSVHLHDGRAAAVGVTRPDGSPALLPASHVVSSMPLGHLVSAMEPAAPPEVRAAAGGLTYRHFIVVALVVPAGVGFPDHWVYVHTPAVRVGRIQNYGRWSPDMVKEGRTCLGLEYFTSDHDELWQAPEAALVERGAAELEQLGLARAGDVEEGFAVRVPRAYPVYGRDHREKIRTIAGFLATHASNVHAVGRNGMHRYNNQDHSMLTAMLAVENILGASHDVWAVEAGRAA